MKATPQRKSTSTSNSVAGPFFQAKPEHATRDIEATEFRQPTFFHSSQADAAGGTSFIQPKRAKSVFETQESGHTPFFQHARVPAIQTDKQEQTEEKNSETLPVQRKPIFESDEDVQFRLVIGQPGDFYEQEADRMADRVAQHLPQKPKATESLLSSAHSGLQRKPIFESEAVPEVQAKPARGDSRPVSPVQRKCAECESEDELQKLEEPGKEEALQQKPIFESAAAPPTDEGEGDEPLNRERGNGDQLQFKCAECAAEEEETVQRLESADATPVAPDGFSSQLRSNKGSGSTLPEETRTHMEGVFGADFSGVRIHADSAAERMSESVQAQAFTHGNDIYFGAGQYSPQSTDGQKLLAHELTHTIQQGANMPSLARKDVSTGNHIVDPDDSMERDADRIAERVALSAPEREMRSDPAQLSQPLSRSPVFRSATYSAIQRLCTECEEKEQQAQTGGMVQRKIAPDITQTVQQGAHVQRQPVPDIQKQGEHRKYGLTYLFKNEYVYLEFDLQEKAFTTVTSNQEAENLIKQGLDKVLYVNGEPVYETPTFLKTDRVRGLIKADIDAWSGTGVPVMNQLDKVISKRSQALFSTLFMQKVNDELATVHSIDPSFIDWNLLIPEMKLNVFTWVPKDAVEASEYDQYEWVLDLLAKEAKALGPVAGPHTFDPATINSYLYPFIVNNDALFSHEIIKEHSEKFVVPWLDKISQIKFVPENFSIKAFEPGEDVKKAAIAREKLLSEFIEKEVPDLIFRFILDTWTASGVNPDLWLKQLNIDSYKANLLEHLAETFMQKAKQDPQYITALKLEAVEKTKFTIIKMFYAAALNMQTSNAGLEKEFRKGYKENLDKGLVAIIENPANYFELSEKISSATTTFLNSIQPDRTLLTDVVASLLNLLDAMQVPKELSALAVFFTAIGNYVKDFRAAVDEEKGKVKEAIKARINIDYDRIANVVKNWQKVAEEFMEKKFKPMLKTVALEWLAANKKEIQNILANYDSAQAKAAQQMDESATELEYIAEGLVSDEYEEIEYQGEILTKNELPYLRTTIQFLRDEAKARISKEKAEKEKGKLREALEVYDETRQDVIDDEFDWLDYVEPIFKEARRRLGISEFPSYTTYRDVFSGRIVAEKNPFLAMVIQNYYWKEDIERGMWQAFKIVGLGILTIGAMFVPGVGGMVLGAIDIGVSIGMGVQGVIDAKEVLRMAKLDIHGTIRGVTVEQAEEALKHAWLGLIVTVALTAGPIAISRALKVRGRGGVLLSKETQAWERTLSKETREALKAPQNSALRKLYAEMDEGVRAILTLCDSPCIPMGYGPKPAEVTRIKDFMKQVKVPSDHRGLREYLHHPSRRTNLTKAMDDLDGVKNMTQLEARLERAVAANVKQAGASANKVGGIWHYTRPDGTIVKEYEIARHGDLSVDMGTARFFQSHHGIQDAWAIKKGIPGYARDDCPAILLRDSKMGTPHQIVSARQSGRFDTVSSRTYAQERELLKADMKAAGVTTTKANKIVQESDAYFGKLYKQIKAQGNTAELTRIFGTWKP
jgi:hypothetical protein